MGIGKKGHPESRISSFFTQALSHYLFIPGPFFIHGSLATSHGSLLYLNSPVSSKGIRKDGAPV
jgi:hypothetical protein